MRETKKCYTVDPELHLNPMLRFEVYDGAEILHELREDLVRGHGIIEIELTIRYPEEARR